MYGMSIYLSNRSMEPYTFNNLTNDLKIGREIEFTYDNTPCSITNGRGEWWFTKDKDSQAICAFEDKELLVQKVEIFMVSGVSVKDIFNGLLYAPESLYIL